MSQTTNLKLFKHDNPSTNQNQFDIDESLNKNWDKIDNFVGGINTRIEQTERNIKTVEQNLEEQGSKITALETADSTNREDIIKLKQECVKLKQENTELKNQIPSGKSEISENITLKDSSDLECKVNVQGNSWQEENSSSPTMQNPIKLEAVGDNINLINKNNPLHYSTYGSRLDNTVLKEDSNYTGYLFKCKPNTKYTISRGDLNSQRFRAFCFDEDPTQNLSAVSTNGFYGDSVGGTAVLSKTFQTTANSKYIYTLFGYDGILSEKAKAEEGPIRTEYSPYNCGNVKLNVYNKNIANAQKLFEEMQAFKSNSVRTEMVNERNCIVFNNSQYLKTSGFKGMQWRYKENTRYVIRGRFRVYDTNLTSGNTLYLMAYDKEGNMIASADAAAQGKEWIQFSVITNEGSSLDYISFSYGSITLWCLDMDSLEIYESTKLEDFVEHQEQNVIFSFTEGQRLLKNCKLGDTGIVHNRKRIALTGNESLSRNNDYGNVCSFTILEYQNIINKNDALDISCNMLKANTGTGANVIRIATETGNIVMNFNKTDVEYDVVALRTKLTELYNAGTPMEIEIPLETPEIEQYTEEQKLAKAEIDKLKTYKGVTHITTDSRAILDVSYKKDLETLIKSN